MPGAETFDNIEGGWAPGAETFAKLKEGERPELWVSCVALVCSSIVAHLALVRRNMVFVFGGEPCSCSPRIIAVLVLARVFWFQCSHIHL